MANIYMCDVHAPRRDISNSYEKVYPRNRAGTEQGRSKCGAWTGQGQDRAKTEQRRSTDRATNARPGQGRTKSKIGADPGQSRGRAGTEQEQSKAYCKYMQKQ